MPKWKIDDVNADMPSGAAGSDSWTCDELWDLCETSKKILLLLLDAAAMGKLLTFWEDTRVATIPKPDSLEKRPLTIFSNISADPLLARNVRRVKTC